MSDQTTQEPTMEEILASIRRIISEDEPAEGAAAAQPEPDPEPEDEPEAVVAAAPEPAPEPVAVEEEPLELTQRYEEPAPVSAPEPAVEVETIGDIEASAPADPFPAYEPEPAPPAPEPAFAPEPVAAAVTASMAGGTTVEDLVRSIVEPQVRTWLEQNLDGLLRDMLREKLNNVFR